MTLCELLLEAGFGPMDINAIFDGYVEGYRDAYEVPEDCELADFEYAEIWDVIADMIGGYMFRDLETDREGFNHETGLHISPEVFAKLRRLWCELERIEEVEQ